MMITQYLPINPFVSYSPTRLPYLLLNSKVSRIALFLFMSQAINAVKDIRMGVVAKARAEGMPVALVSKLIYQ